jgi:cell division protein YceG involved in septum cleavage
MMLIIGISIKMKCPFIRKIIIKNIKIVKGRSLKIKGMILIKKYMNNKIIVLVVVLVILAALAGFGGYWLGLEKSKAMNKNNMDMLSSSMDMLSLLKSSTVVPVNNAFGTVTDISGRNITLSSGVNKLTVAITPDAKIFRYALVGKPTEGLQKVSAPEPATFEDIKLKDNLNVTIKILGNNQVQGTTAYILP